MFEVVGIVVVTPLSVCFNVRIRLEIELYPSVFILTMAEYLNEGDSFKI